MLTPPEHETGEQATESRQAASGDGATDPVVRRSEEIHIRNFDFDREYHLRLTVRDADGIAFANRYQLTPGKTVSELGRLAPGTYEIEVDLDGRRSHTTRCVIDETPEKTALVEVGNGTVSVTEGLYC